MWQSSFKSWVNLVMQLIYIEIIFSFSCKKLEKNQVSMRENSGNEDKRLCSISIYKDVF